MTKDIESHIKRKRKPHKVEIQNIEATHPLELVHIDFLMIESGKSNKEVNILVITDHFTKYAQAYVTKLQTTFTVLRHFGRSISCIMSFPKSPEWSGKEH